MCKLLFVGDKNTEMPDLIFLLYRKNWSFVSRKSFCVFVQRKGSEATLEEEKTTPLKEVLR
jgi:hypothetical protein